MIRTQLQLTLVDGEGTPLERFERVINLPFLLTSSIELIDEKPEEMNYLIIGLPTFALFTRTLYVNLTSRPKISLEDAISKLKLYGWTKVSIL